MLKIQETRARRSSHAGHSGALRVELLNFRRVWSVAGGGRRAAGALWLVAGGRWLVAAGGGQWQAAGGRWQAGLERRIVSCPA